MIDEANNYLQKDKNIFVKEFLGMKTIQEEIREEMLELEGHISRQCLRGMRITNRV